MAVVGVFILTTDSKHRDLLIGHQPGRHLVLRAEGIRGARRDFRSTRLQHSHQITRLRGHVEAGGKAHPRERTLSGKALVYQLQYRHALRRPLHSGLALRGQAKITYVVVHVTPLSKPVLITSPQPGAIPRLYRCVPR